MPLFPTHILEILLKRKLLGNRLSFLFGEKAAEAEAFLRRMITDGEAKPDQAISELIPGLLNYGIVSERKRSKNRRCSLKNVYAVNFELTYRCQYRCSHCLQSDIRDDIKDELSTAAVKDAILRGYVAGLWSGGLNFTGGEVLGNRDDLFEILDYAHSLGIPFRLNTNSWWAAKSTPEVCGVKFSSPSELIRFIAKKGLERFAFSFDDRYEENERYEPGFLESVRLCEKEGVNYEIVFSGVSPADIYDHLRNIAAQCGIRPSALEYRFSTMEMVDIGGAADAPSEKYSFQKNRCSCERKKPGSRHTGGTYLGFSQPIYLHISPDGKVRTCLYAIGLENAGNLNASSLTEIINNFPDTLHNEIFLDEKRLNELNEEIVKPFLYIYRPLFHQCTRNIILARIYQKYFTDGEQNLDEIHLSVALEMNLLNKTD